MNYTKTNNITGWATFAIAAVVYLLTIEPTTSFWDCGEYIATAYKLQVGHPPGAPFFQFMGAFFSIFTFGDVTKVAMMVNAMSAISSAFTILFLFWSITAIAKKLVDKNEDGSLDQANLIAVMGAGLVGALAYTFSDSFWFSAVEGEVYAMSSFFAAISFWMILKWEAEVGKPGANRWLILLFFMMGLAVGVHLLAILVFPSVVMIYYYKKYKPSRQGFVIASITGIVVLGIAFKVILQFVLTFSAKMELFFVNSLGMPFDSGTIFAFLALATAIYFGIRWTRKKNYPLLNTILLGVIFMILGYSAFLSLVIRSNANPPIDENNPEDAVSLISYLNREQYGNWPILHGWYYNSELDRRDPFDDGNPVYERDEESGKYVVVNDMRQSIPKYDKRGTSFFPRMWDRNEPSHADTYKEWGRIKTPDDRMPSMKENLTYFWRYQVQYMYFRYFFWNFVGRQNDEQGRGGISEGMWISGINFVDEARLGPQDNLPVKYTRNKGRNRYFALPFILGLIGLFYHVRKNRGDAWVVGLLFLMTGLAIVVYINQYAYQPRERDYAYVGSFYAFAIWIGLGVLSLFEILKKKAPPKAAALVVTAICLLAVPTIMAKENWDDHDRSNRYTARDFARNYLNSCEKDAILFTNGDNDTFPLWYVQEVEDYRTDVRIVNLSLLNTDWYIDQMKRAAYDAKPVPFSLTKDQYRQGTRDIVYYFDRGLGDKRWDVKDFMKWIASDEKITKVQTQGGTNVDFFPVKKLNIPVDREKVVASGLVAPEDSSLVPDNLEWNLKRNNLLKRDLMIVDLLANNDWERPIYFAITVGNSPSAFLHLTEYFRLEGMAYRLVPYKKSDNDGQMGYAHGEVMYQNMMNEFEFGNMEDPNVYMDETNRRMTMNFRNNFARCARALRVQGDAVRAEEVLDKAFELMPDESSTYDFFCIPLAEEYYQLGKNDKAGEILDILTSHYEHEMRYYTGFPQDKIGAVNRNLRRATQIYSSCAGLARQYGDGPRFDAYNATLNNVLGPR